MAKRMPRIARVKPTPWPVFASAFLLWKGQETRNTLNSWAVLLSSEVCDRFAVAQTEGIPRRQGGLATFLSSNLMKVEREVVKHVVVEGKIQTTLLMESATVIVNVQLHHPLSTRSVLTSMLNKLREVAPCTSELSICIIRGMGRVRLTASSRTSFCKTICMRCLSSYSTISSKSRNLRHPFRP